MKKFTIVLFLLIGFWCAAQDLKTIDTVNFNEDIKTLKTGLELLQQNYEKVKTEINSIKKNLTKIKQNLSGTNLQLDSLQKQTKIDKGRGYDL